VIGAVAVLLVVVGIFAVVYWMTEPGGQPLLPFLASKTPTPTNTNTPTPVTPTDTPTLFPTETLTPTITLTPTASGPFEYLVQQDDNCFDLAARYNVELLVLLKINNFGNGCPIAVGQKILIPAPDTQLPTETPVDLTTLKKGFIIKGYMIKSGEYLSLIAERFLTTVDAIIKQNKLEDENAIFAGQMIDIPVNLITPVPTRAPTVTPGPGTPSVTPSMTLTPTP
jgi:LysM repeat protein